MKVCCLCQKSKFIMENQPMNIFSAIKQQSKFVAFILSIMMSGVMLPTQAFQWR